MKWKSKSWAQINREIDEDIRQEDIRVQRWHTTFAYLPKRFDDFNKVWFEKCSRRRQWKWSRRKGTDVPYWQYGPLENALIEWAEK